MYVYLKKWGNKLYSTYYKDGKKIQDVSEPSVEVFVPTQNKTKYKVYPSNKPVEKMVFKSINDYKDFKDNIGTNLIYGNLGQYHNELYSIRQNKLYSDLNVNLLKVFNIDIEVYSEHEFPEPNEAKHPITTLCIIERSTKKSIIWGYCDYTPHQDNIEYRKFNNEAEMMIDFCKFIGQENPDVMVGWNAIWFDFPYIWNRIKQLFGESYMTFGKLLSPFHKVIDTQKFHKTRKYTVNTMDIFGTQLFDMMDIDIKYTPFKRSSYSLNNVAQEELKMSKLDFSEEGNLSNLYNNNPQKYIEYEYRDTDILYKYDKKRNLINKIFGICHYAKMPVEKHASPVLLWESIMFNALMDDNKVFPIKQDHDSVKGIEGAYVKMPIPKIHGWTASVDVNSEYPHTMIKGNISPETKVNNYPSKEVEELARIVRRSHVDDIVDRKIDFSILKDHNLFMAANGSIYRKDIKGVGPTLMETLYNLRNEHKDEMLKLAALYESGENKSEAMKIKIEDLDNLQWSEKIILNCFYGAFSNIHFRFYDKEIAEAITLTAQVIIKSSEMGLNKFINSFLKTKNKDYVFYSDTDSNYIECDLLVEKLLKKKPNSTKTNIVDFIDIFFKKKIEPTLKKIFTDLAEYMNAYKDCIVMKREIIAESGFWLAKKKYALLVWDEEGKRFTEPKLKIKGIQVVRSDTPKAIKPHLKELIKKILNGTNVKKYIKEVKSKILQMDINDIAISKSVNNIKKYTEIVNGNIWYKKGTPIHVRAAILHNLLISVNNLQGKYKEIANGDKIKYVYMLEHNIIDENVIGFRAILPEEFKLNKYVDKEMQYEKIFGKIADDMCKVLNISQKETLF